MSTLQGTKIKDTYPGLIKTSDNAVIGATEKTIQDGLGNESTLSLGTTSASFNGTLDLTNATVTGLAGGAGLVAGTGSGSAESDITGAESTASGTNSIAIGNNSTASGTGAMAYGNEAQATQTHSAAFGQYAEATNSYAIAFGRTSAASGDGSVAFGQQTSAAQAGAVAMGRQVTSDTADTTHVRALKIVAPDGGTGGNGITMLSPDGTAGVITLTNSSELAVDGTPIGGGGGGSSFTGLVGTSKGLFLQTPATNQDQMRTTYVPDTYGTSTYSMPANKLAATAMSIKAGQTVDNFAIYITTAITGGTISCALYKAQAGNGGIDIGALEYNFGTIDASTTGYKKITGANHTLGSTLDDVYFLVVKNNGTSTGAITAVGSTNLSGTLTHSSLYATTSYRGNTWEVTYSTAGIPANGSGLNWTKSTGFPLKAIS
jgi:hypothetical protein